MTFPTDEDLALYAMGQYDGDTAALEAALAAEPSARDRLATEAELELLLREAGAAASVCPGCGDVVRDDRCAACGVAVDPGGYTVERVLVQSAHGRMYLARDADGTQVALKELAFVHAPGPKALAAFEREAKMLRALEHPAIPRFCAAFEEGAGVHTRYYLAQEYIEGQPLDARLDEHFYSEHEIIALAKSVLDVLIYLQGLSPLVIHRDIKPANMLRRLDGSIALVDFGAAHVQGSTVGSTSIGTFGYMPIEQLVGIVDTTTDGYALGASLLHLITRREPWRILHPQAFGMLNVSPALRGFLEKLVASEPGQRFANAAAARAALDRLGAITPAPATPRRTRWSTALVGVATLAVAFTGTARIMAFAHRNDTSSDGERSAFTPPRVTEEKPPAPSSPDNALARLHIESEPAGAAVLIWGKDAGRTPLDTGVPVGKEAQIELLLPGYQRSITNLVPDKSTAMMVTMQRMYEHLDDMPNAFPRVSPHQKWADGQCTKCHPSSQALFMSPQGKLTISPPSSTVTISPPPATDAKKAR